MADAKEQYVNKKRLSSIERGISISDFTSPKLPLIMHVMIGKELTSMEWMKELCRMTDVPFSAITKEEKACFHVTVSRLKKYGYIAAVDERPSGPKGGKPAIVYCPTQRGLNAYYETAHIMKRVCEAMQCFTHDT